MMSVSSYQISYFEILKRTYSYFTIHTMCVQSERAEEKERKQKSIVKIFFIAILTFLLCNMIHVVLSHSLNMFKIKY